MRTSRAHFATVRGDISKMSGKLGGIDEWFPDFRFALVAQPRSPST
jgi:hypothetical protein